MANMTPAAILHFAYKSPDPGSDISVKPAEKSAVIGKIKYQREWWESRARRELGW